MGLQKASQAAGVLIVLFNSQRQRFQTTLQLVASMGIERAAVVDRILGHFPDYRRRGDDHTGINIGVTVEVFGSTVDHRIDAQADGVLV
jgi:hypothetical protein